MNPLPRKYQLDPPNYFRRDIKKNPGEHPALGRVGVNLHFAPSRWA